MDAVDGGGIYLVTDSQYAERLFRLVNRQHGKCGICRQLMSWQDAVDIHHARAHNTVANRHRWPHCIEHDDNLLVAHHEPCHMGKPNYGRWTERQMDAWEAKLAAADT